MTIILILPHHKKGSVVTLVCLRQSTRTCVIHGLARYSFVRSRSKRVDRCVWC